MSWGGGGGDVSKIRRVERMRSRQCAAMDAIFGKFEPSRLNRGRTLAFVQETRPGMMMRGQRSYRSGNARRRRREGCETNFGGGSRSMLWRYNRPGSRVLDHATPRVNRRGRRGGGGANVGRGLPTCTPHEVEGCLKLCGLAQHTRFRESGGDGRESGRSLRWALPAEIVIPSMDLSGSPGLLYPARLPRCSTLATLCPRPLSLA